MIVWHFITNPYSYPFILYSMSGILCKEWKINIFKIIDTRISFNSRNTHRLTPQPRSSFRHLKRRIQDFHMNYVLVPVDKTATMLLSDDCIILIILNMSLLAPMPIKL